MNPPRTKKKFVNRIEGYSTPHPIFNQTCKECGREFQTLDKEQRDLCQDCNTRAVLVEYLSTELGEKSYGRSSKHWIGCRGCEMPFVKRWDEVRDFCLWCSAKEKIEKTTTLHAADNTDVSEKRFLLLGQEGSGIEHLLTVEDGNSVVRLCNRIAVGLGAEMSKWLKLAEIGDYYSHSLATIVRVKDITRK
jgi:hypothetical protein